MTEPKSKLQTVRQPTPGPLLAAELELDDFTQHVETPLAADGPAEDEPTLVGLDFDDLARAL